MTNLEWPPLSPAPLASTWVPGASLAQKFGFRPGLCSPELGPAVPGLRFLWTWPCVTTEHLSLSGWLHCPSFLEHAGSVLLMQVVMDEGMDWSGLWWQGNPGHTALGTKETLLVDGLVPGCPS